MARLWARFALLLFSIVVTPGCAQSTPEVQLTAQVAQTFWTDPSTGLMWAAKDNGKDVNWKQAMKFCRDSKLGGYSDWRLATMDELQGIYDKNANAPGQNGKGETTWHVKGNLFLTGYQWSSEQKADDRGKPSGYAPQFDFNSGQVFNGDEVSFYVFKRALCVRSYSK